MKKDKQWSTKVHIYFDGFYTVTVLTSGAVGKDKSLNVAMDKALNMHWCMMKEIEKRKEIEAAKLKRREVKIKGASGTSNNTTIRLQSPVALRTTVDPIIDIYHYNNQQRDKAR